MSDTSSRGAGWPSRLRPPPPPPPRPAPDDPRLGELVEPWDGDPAAFRPGRPVLIGFPTDVGVRRNGGRPGAAQAPAEIRRWLHRLVGPEAPQTPLDLGDVATGDDLEADQALLGEVVAAVLRARAVAVVLGGGHETAFGHFLGHVGARQPLAIVNIDAHLDVRPLRDGLGHSGSPFRQALEHPSGLLRGEDYCCLGAQPSSCARSHVAFVEGQGGRIGWCEEVRGRLGEHFRRERERLRGQDRRLYVSIDADAARAADVPGVSAPCPTGLAGEEVALVAELAGLAPEVTGLGLVEIAPPLDVDGGSARWGAVVVWRFLAGLARRALDG